MTTQPKPGDHWTHPLIDEQMTRVAVAYPGTKHEYLTSGGCAVTVPFMPTRGAWSVSIIEVRALLPPGFP